MSYSLDQTVCKSYQQTIKGFASKERDKGYNCTKCTKNETCAKLHMVSYFIHFMSIHNMFCLRNKKYNVY